MPMMQLTGQNRFASILSGGYEVMNGSHVRKLFFKKGRRSNQRKRSLLVNGNSQLISAAVEDGE